MYETKKTKPLPSFRWYSKTKYIDLTGFWSIFLFYSPGNQRFSEVFRGYKLGTLTKNILNDLWMILQVWRSWQTVSILPLIIYPIQCCLSNCFNVITSQPPAMAHYLSIHCKLYKYKGVMKHFQKNKV